MSSISAIDTSQYTSAIASTMVEHSQMSAGAGVSEYKQEQLPNVAATEETTPEVDLSNYYANVVPTNADPHAQQGLKAAAQTLDNAVSAAVMHGMSTQDAINIQSAKAAYQANSEALKSTFELAV